VPTLAFTIQKLADAAGVGVEAVRYYQRRGLLRQPERIEGGFREYTQADVDRLRFIKRGQELGFSLDDIAELTALSSERNRSRVRALTRLRVAEIRGRIAQLESVAAALEGLAETCSRTPQARACPIIAALAPEATATPTAPSRVASRPIRRSVAQPNAMRSSARGVKATQA